MPRKNTEKPKVNLIQSARVTEREEKICFLWKQRNTERKVQGNDLKATRAMSWSSRVKTRTQVSYGDLENGSLKSNITPFYRCAEQKWRIFQPEMGGVYRSRTNVMIQVFHLTSDLVIKLKYLPRVHLKIEDASSSSD